MKIELTTFVMRQFDAKFAGTKMHKVDIEHFINLSNTAYNTAKLRTDSNILLPGGIDFKLENHKSWDFCKYLFIKNDFDFDIRTAVAKINQFNCQYVQSSYSSRTETELAVLSRWIEFPKTANYKAPKADWIALVLYSREQLLKEFESNAQPPESFFELSEDCEYGIVSINALTSPEMEPMPPITHLRNALGMEYGGNGNPIDIEEYNRSVEFWQEHALVK